MVEGTGKRAKTTDRHIITLSPELDEQVDRVLDLASVHEAVSPVKALLSTNVGAAAGILGLVVALLAFKPTQAVAVEFIGFIRMQIASIASDIASNFVPTADQVAEEVANATKRLRDAAAALFRKLEEEARQRQDVEFGPAGPVGVPVDPAFTEFLRNFKKAQEGL